jgi:hypothetical protein
MNSTNSTNSTCSFTEEELTDISGAVYYSTEEDNTFGTYFTDFVWAFLLLLTVLLLVWKNPRVDKEYSYVLYMISLVFLCFSTFLGGLYHALCTKKDDACHDPLWDFTMAMQMFSGSFTCMTAFSLLTRADNNMKNYLFYAISGFIGLCFSIYSFFVAMPFALSALIGNFGPSIFLLVSVLTKPFKFYSVVYLAGFVLYLIGAAIQVSGSGVCSSDCPVDCPYAVPDINHNGMLHVFAMVGYIAMPFGFYLLSVAEASKIAVTPVEEP